MNGFNVEIRNLTVRYGNQTALDSLSASFAAGMIHGLLGRNGSGKTTLLSVIASFRRATSGQVLVNGEDPFENAELMRGTCLIRDSVDVPYSGNIADVLRYAAQMRPGWNQELAGRLVDRFELPLRKQPATLSRGQVSALGVTLGLASRAPLTLFDETYLGMDAPSRYAFYDELLADYVEQPRTIILSSHLIGEIERLFEHVVMLDSGRLLLADSSENLRAKGTTVTGAAGKVAAFTRGHTVIASQELGNTHRVTLFGQLSAAERASAAEQQLELGSVALQDLFVHLTGKSKEGRS